MTDKLLFIPVYERDVHGNAPFSYVHVRLVKSIAKRMGLIFCTPGEKSYVNYDWKKYWDDILYEENITTVPIDFRFRYDFDEKTLAPLHRDMYEWRSAYCMDIRAYFRLRRALLRFRPSAIETKIFSYQIYNFEFRGMEHLEMIGCSPSKYFYPSTSCQYLKNEWLSLLGKYLSPAKIKDFDKYTPVFNLGIDIEKIDKVKKDAGKQNDVSIVLPYHIDHQNTERHAILMDLLKTLKRKIGKSKLYSVYALRYPRVNPRHNISEIVEEFPFLKIIDDPHLDWYGWYKVCCESNFFLCPVPTSVNDTKAMDLLYGESIGLFVDDVCYHYLENYPYIVDKNDFKKLMMVCIFNDGFIKAEENFKKYYPYNIVDMIRTNFDLNLNIDKLAEYICNVHNGTARLMKP